MGTSDNLARTGVLPIHELAEKTVSHRNAHRLSSRQSCVAQQAFRRKRNTLKLAPQVLHVLQEAPGQLLGVLLDKPSVILDPAEQILFEFRKIPLRFR